MLTRRALLLTGLCAGVAARVAEAPGAPRMLVLGGDLAEIVFALGAGDHVVATDDTALWPPDAADLPKVGYLRRLSAEGVLSLAPDLVLASADAGPPAVMEQIRAAGFDVETAPEGQGIAAVLAKIAFVREVLGLEARAAALAEEVSSGMAALERGLADLPSVLFLMSAGKGPPVAAGTGTAADGMISLAHGRNVVEGFAGYKPLSAEAAVALAPEVVVLPDHAAEAAGGRRRSACGGEDREHAGRCGGPCGGDGRAEAARLRAAHGGRGRASTRCIWTPPTSSRTEMVAVATVPRRGRLPRGALLLMVFALTAVVLAVAGPISFIGLVAPHVARLCVGPGHRLVARPPR